MNSLSRVIIFGATSTIAEHTARALVQSGASVFCIGRNPEKLQRLLADLRVRACDKQIIDGISADLGRCEQHEELFNLAKKSIGEYDSILIAHGTLPNQKNCEQDFQLLQECFHINMISAINLLAISANIFEKKGCGVIAAITSVAGDRGRQSNYAYGSAKGAVTLFMQGLRNRLFKKGVAVVTIKPGFVRTRMTDDFERHGILWTDPDVIAKGIIHAMRKGKNEVYLPWFWFGIMTIIKIIPQNIFKRLSL